MNSKSVKLLPCPFCGGKAEIKRRGTSRASMQIACEQCGALVESGDVCGLTNPHHYQWNRRATDRQRYELREAAKDLLKYAAHSMVGANTDQPDAPENDKWKALERLRQALSL